RPRCRCPAVVSVPTRSLTFFFSSRRRHTRSKRDWSSDVCSSDLQTGQSAPGWTKYPSAPEPAPSHEGKKLGLVHQQPSCRNRRRSEERRVGKEWRGRGGPGRRGRHARAQRERERSAQAERAARET